MSDDVVVNKYGIQMIPRAEKVPPKDISHISDEEFLEIARRVMFEHKDVLDALAKR